MRMVLQIGFALLPSFLKCFLLRRMGHEVGKGVRIGVSMLGIQHLDLGENSRIGHGNVFKGIQQLQLGPGAMIGRFNLFTCSPYYLGMNRTRAGRINVGAGAAITMRHYFDVQDLLEIGDNSLVAGIQTMVFTHQKGLMALNEFKPVRIGNRVYIGAGCTLLPGATVADYIVIGAGSIVGGNLSESYQLYSSPRAVAVKQLSKEMPYFSVENPAGLKPNDSPKLGE